MARNTEDLKRRQQDIIAALRRERLKHPKWEYSFVVAEVARQFYLSTHTIIKEIKKQYD